MHLRGHFTQGAKALEERVGLAGDLVERQLPAADAVRVETLHDPERGRQRAPVVGVRAVERRDVREPARRQEGEELELRIGARLEFAEHLHNELLAEHERRVGLLDADRSDRDVLRQAERAAHALEGEAALVRLDRVLSVHACEKLAPVHRVGERVVDRPLGGLGHNVL